MGSSSFPLEHNKCDGRNDICGQSYCKWSTEQYHSENTYPFSRCSQACLRAVGEGKSLSAPRFTPPPTVPGGGGGGGGVCRDQGGTPNYAGDLQNAMNEVRNKNPDSIMGKANTKTNSFAYLNYVIEELKSAGFNAAANVLNGNDNPNNGDLIAVWREGDSTIERYDVISDVGSGSMPLTRAVTTPIYTGDIPLTCIR